MSGILGILGTGLAATRESTLQPVLRALSLRGRDSSAVSPLPPALLAVQRAEWEMGSDFSDGVLIAHDGSLAVAADASLYYRADLGRKLSQAGVPTSGSSPGHFILAAYRAWGIGCASQLEGDFAFILWDGEKGLLHAARDFSGRRPLFYARIGESLLFASTIGALKAHPGCPADLNLVVLAETAAGTVASAEETTFRGILAVPPGHSLSCRFGGGLEVTRHWEPPTMRQPSDPPTSLEEGGEQLRMLLAAAVDERIARASSSAISLSGGWDSTAVFGIGQSVLTHRGEGVLQPISISYPPGDAGREDEYILETTGRWNIEPHWLQIEAIPMFHRSEQEAGEREEPFVHPFQHWNIALAEAGRSVGARVMLDGFGGDQLFSASNSYLAGLLREGRWAELYRRWRPIAPGRDLANQFRTIVEPALPGWALELASAIRGGRPLYGFFHRRPAPWIRADFAARYELKGRQDRLFPPGQASSTGAAEFRYYLTTPFLAAIISRVSRYSLDAGVEQRSPLFDARVIRFAASRPFEERNSGAETKRVLRHAVRGLVPDRVLAPRSRKTGTTFQAFLRAMRRDFPALAEATFARAVLPELGIVDLACLREAAADFAARRTDIETASQLYFTLQTELWLQNHLGVGERREPAVS